MIPYYSWWGIVQFCDVLVRMRVDRRAWDIPRPFVTSWACDSGMM